MMQYKYILAVIIGFQATSSIQQSLNSTANGTATTTNQTILSQIASVAAKATDCAGCFDLAEALKIPAALGPDTVASIGTTLCIALGEGTALECQGLQKLEAPSVTFAILSSAYGSHSQQVFCEALFGLCPQPPIINYTVPIPKPKPACATRPRPSGQDPIYVVHLSDLHVDSKYTPGLSYNVRSP